MQIEVKQISSLDKVLSLSDTQHEVRSATLLKGERFSYQLALISDGIAAVTLAVDSPLKEYIRLYNVQNAVLDYPRHHAHEVCDDYVATVPGIMPDILRPMAQQDCQLWLNCGIRTVWVEVFIPEDFTAGTYDIVLKTDALPNVELQESVSLSSVFTVTVANEVLPEQKLLYTQWFYADCISSVHHAEMYSERHWELIDSYMKMARELGVNMLMVPVISPALDTAVGNERPNSQLLRITKCGETYSFDFTLVRRWVQLCKKHGFSRFEMSHLFSQGGAAYSPNIYATENGEEKRIFGWDIPSKDVRYEAFLKQMIPCLVSFLKEEGIAQNTYFHFSDEPTVNDMENYRYIHDLISPMLENCQSFDALSDYEFYGQGLIDNPVCGTHAIMDFIAHGTENLWAYNCCFQGIRVANRHLSMPSYRNRIHGLQLYKYNIKGFLHWGYNFYYSRWSLYSVNPYATTSADKGFPSGDAFSVYPGENGPVKSIRAEVFFESLQDIRVCRKLEEYIGRDAVVKMIDDAAGMDITFEDYPRNAEFIPALMQRMKEMITEYH